MPRNSEPTIGHFKRPELWGGVECTLNRVGDRYFDQLKRTGHLERVSDIDRFADLGIRTLRVPILWERALHGPTDKPDFGALEPILARMRERGMRVIAGLCHHGSGPPFTHLLDPEFPAALAAYADEVARRFPWIEDYTPINEPVTTARFSALYGHWYPHARSTPAFLRALVHEVRATILAMDRIRKVVPHARLIQTEDLPWIRSTEALGYQAEYENDRRFLSFDLLCGRVDREHSLHVHLLENGVSEAELDAIRDQPCPPDIIGLNYYLTSDRYLDHRIDRFPAHAPGGNGRTSYVDLDAVRVPGIGIAGHRHVLQTAWDRYQLPLALTEVHVGCTREEQVRWMVEAWEATCDAVRSGIDVRGFAAWALLGSHDWNSLVRVDAGHYECGVFDVRAPEPRPTLLADVVRSLATAGTYEHPLLDAPGWWRRIEQPPPPAPKCRPLLITGGTGKLGRALAAACEARGLAVVAPSHAELDACDRAELREWIRTQRPWGVINAAGFTRLAASDRDMARCFRDNMEAATTLADVCEAARLPLMTFSSDWVFDGTLDRPYVESDPTSPMSVYGLSQAYAERRVANRCQRALIVRTSQLFGWSDADALHLALSRLATGRRVVIEREHIAARTYVPHLVTACLDLFLDGASGLWHLATVGRASMRQLLTLLAAELQLSGELSNAVEPLEPQDIEPVRCAVLSSERATLMPPLSSAIAEYAAHHAASLRRRSRGVAIAAHDELLSARE